MDHAKNARDLMAENTLYFGDNLRILRDNIRDETVDLIYLNPPFNSKANYNACFARPEGHESRALITPRRHLELGEQAETEFAELNQPHSQRPRSGMSAARCNQFSFG